MSKEESSPFNIQTKKRYPQNNQTLRDSDVYFENYSPLPIEDDHETMFSPSRPSEYSLPWPFNRYQRQHRFRRLVDRDGQFHQSKGKLSIRKKIKITQWRSLYGTDWFHSLVNSPTWRMIIVLLSLYVIMILLFAIPYYHIARIDNDVCHLDIHNYHEAFNFSLETMATIGYSTKDIFFGDCVVVSIMLTLQVCTKIILDALTIGVIYSRLARPTTRASTIILSSNAVIRRIRGKLFLMFQICELRKHQLVEAHVRLYLLKNEVDMYNDHSSMNRESLSTSSSYNGDEVRSPVSYNNTQGSRYFQTFPLRINQPSDERGAMLLLCLPQVVVHEINETSPLRPPDQWRSNLTGHTYSHGEIMKSMQARPSIERSSSSGKDEQYTTPQKRSQNPSVSSKASSNHNNDHDAYQVIDDDRIADETPEQRLERYMIQTYMLDRKIEIISIVEGTDQATGGVVQARHSFVPTEVKWHHTFAPCVFEDEIDGSAVIDFNMFHQLRPVAADTSSNPASFIG